MQLKMMTVPEAGFWKRVVLSLAQIPQRTDDGIVGVDFWDLRFALKSQQDALPAVQSEGFD